MSPRRRQGSELPWEFLRRSVRPFHLAVAASTGVIAYLDVIANTTRLSRTTWGDVIGVVAALATVLLVVGWWWRRPHLAMNGLLIAVFVWTWRGVIYLAPCTCFATDTPRWTSAALSFAWVIGAGGAWLLERAEMRHQDWMARGDE